MWRREEEESKRVGSRCILALEWPLGLRARAPEPHTSERMIHLG